MEKQIGIDGAKLIDRREPAYIVENNNALVAQYDDQFSHVFFNQSIGEFIEAEKPILN